MKGKKKIWSSKRLDKRDEQLDRDFDTIMRNEKHLTKGYARGNWKGDIDTGHLGGKQSFLIVGAAFIRKESRMVKVTFWVVKRLC